MKKNSQMDTRPGCDDRRVNESVGLAESDLITRIRDYWNVHIHDLEIAQHPIGTKEFFEELAVYRFDKLDYLPRVYIRASLKRSNE